MIVGIHQPQYLPWLGYFGKILMSDRFVILDTVQYVKNEWQNRNRLRTSTGWQWITVPVEYHFPQTLLETRINNRVPWQRKHEKTIRQLYGHAPFFQQVFPYLEQIYRRPWERLTELNIHLILQLIRLLKIETPLCRASEMAIQATHPTERLIEICHQMGAQTYLSGANGRNYLETDRFQQAGLDLKYQGFIHPEYQQLYPGFESHLSTLDLLFCQGPDETRRLIEAGNRVESE